VAQNRDTLCISLEQEVLQVLHVVGERPGRFPDRPAVSPQVGCKHVEPEKPFLGEPPEPGAVAADPMQAENDRRRGISPLVHVQVHPRILPAALTLP
jgi:hypothetical protein